MQKLVVVLFVALLSQPALTSENHYFIGEVSSEKVIADFPGFARPPNDEDYSAESINRLRHIDFPVTIRVFFGQWCHDSQREVPRLIKLINKTNNPNLQLWLYALDSRKSDPLNLARSHDVKYTPTIIVEREGAELTRFIEVPQLNWADDLVELLAKD